ncbi:LpxL/LpxP family Kdo(2)-lipid IV(A) lauroyl/palmitoleoyl acyltransferase [Salinivibrio sp. ES.052]|uniref:LpxL/LpxP family Kdo(2)-lipid IV(A) lauroyl/palmitoleoyl acyltransferase n=1 Tax=Salinivibrio sp. ES.052 TaxID=1882823 RepID=UPI000926C756|nr:LpxL/LpxP family Kdo(2)-lipid IV(A) lauroyl/palmitoleoyl acyltransferase [Salinivibrio sp. ES.052]SIO27870.1 KDO2-lipid IV(A) lauroyltransferase [Salinivibrio sp. ES.052]
MSDFSPPTFRITFFHPRYLHTWLGIAVMYLASWLPYRVQFYLGRGLGRLMHIFMKRRVNIADRNLELCFPEMTAAARTSMVKENFANSGLALFETGMAWFWPSWRIKKHVVFEGLDTLRRLESEKKGVLVIAVHSMNLELGARGLGEVIPGVGVYRPNNNPVYDWLQHRGRTRHNRAIDRKDVKTMIRHLKKGDRMWYAPDHDYGRRRAAFAPLFAVENACTTTGTSLLVHAGHAAVVPFSIVRERRGGQYRIKIDAPIDNFPKEAQAAAVVTNQAVERLILQAPEQYMWLHRRFKTRPKGEPSLY